MSQKAINVENEQEVWDEVFVPTFLKKCAERGHVAKTEEDASRLIDMAGRLQHMQEAESSNLLKSASAALEKQVPSVTSVAANAADNDLRARAAQLVG